MKKAAILIAPGFEEGEALTIVDILRRAQIHCELVGLKQEVEGAHGVVVQCDRVLEESVQDNDMIILPGGYAGVDALQQNQAVIALIQKMYANGKYVAAMCAAPIVLEQAGVLEGKNYTAYVGYDQKIKQGHYLEEKVVVDNQIVTSRGPATAYAFAYRLVELLGEDALAVKKRMVYFNAFDVKEDE